MISDWKECFWGDIATLEYGKSLRDYRDKNGPYPVYGTNGLIGSHTEPLCINPGVIIGRKGAYRGVHYSHEPFYVIDTAFYLKPKIKDLDLLFAYYELLTHDINSMDSGSAIPSTSREDFYNLPLRLPPIEEQRAISKLLNQFDQKIYLNRQLNRTLEAIGQAIFRHWFVHFEFPDDEGRPYKSSGGELVDSELGEIPVGWEVQEIGTVIETTGGGTPSTKKEEYWENGNIQWFSPRDITGNNQMFITNSEKNINNFGLKNSSAKLFPTYSLMMTSRATVGELSINTKEACTNQGFITCIPNEKLSTYYLYFWIKMNKENIISLASGSTFREINKSTFRGLKIIVPNSNAISSYNSLLRPIFKQIETLQSQNKELSEIRDSLLPKLMSGKIRINPEEEATVK